MYTCLCIGMTDEEVIEKIKDGHNTLDSLMFETGIGLGCGICVQEIEKMIINENKCQYRDKEFPLKVFNV